MAESSHDQNEQAHVLVNELSLDGTHSSMDSFSTHFLGICMRDISESHVYVEGIRTKSASQINELFLKVRR